MRATGTLPVGEKGVLRGDDDWAQAFNGEPLHPPIP